MTTKIDKKSKKLIIDKKSKELKIAKNRVANWPKIQKLSCDLTIYCVYYWMIGSLDNVIINCIIVVYV